MTILRDRPRDLERRPVPLVMGWGVPAGHATGWAVPASGPVRTRWEYCQLQTDSVTVTQVMGEAVEGLTGVPLPDALTRMGAEEWELCAVQEGQAGPIYVFKRPVMGEAAS